MIHLGVEPASTSSNWDCKTPELAYMALIFFLCWLKLLITTPMKRFSMKKDPKIMKITKYIYMAENASNFGC